MAFSQGLCFGRRQLTILTPSPLSLTRRLCFPSHRLTSLEMCQLALSQIRRRVYLAQSLEFLAAPREELRRYGTHGPIIDEPQPHVAESGQVESVTGYGLRLGVVLGDRLLDHARGLALLGEGAQSGQRHPAPPAFVQEADFLLEEQIIYAFVGEGWKQEDDITLVTLRRAAASS